MTIIKIPHECLDAAGLKLRSINTSESTIKVVECDKGGRCIFDKYREKYPVIQEFEKPEYCPLRRPEKEKPKPCEFYGDEEDGKLLCPNCGEDLWDLKECGFNNCPYCGQAVTL